MNATAVAPANIAFIKYWGRKDKELRLPYNPSISMNLSACTTTTSVEFSETFIEESVLYISSRPHENVQFSQKEKERVFIQIDRIRKLAGINTRVKVETQNSFPKSAGIASSASGFAALTIAAAGALGLDFSEQELSKLARVGSGSACRSIPDGFVKWDDEFAYSLYPPDYWDLRDIVVIAGTTGKDVSSSAGHDTVSTSPFFKKRLGALPKRIEQLETALREKNFRLLGEVIEEDCLDMHHVMQTQNPPLFYWNEKTIELMNATKIWRNKGIPVYFTIDAGPNVHLICEGKDEKQIVKMLDGKHQIIINTPARGAHIV